MGTVLERKTIENAEKEKHNAMIGERYRRILEAVEDQFTAEPTAPALEAEAPTYAQATPVSETPATEQTPEVRTYTPSALASSIFTVEKLERLEEKERVEVAPVEQTRAVVKAAPTAVVQYGLTPLAKLAMAIFTLLVIAMLAWIGVNSQTLQRKSIQLKNLEQKKERLMQENEEIQRYIQELQTEESIVQRATEAGLLN